MKKQTKTISVNLGCGTHINKDTKTERWINIDDFELSQSEAPNFIKGDVRNIPLESNSVDYILCDQVLEHMAMADVPVVLYEVRRILKPGGKAVFIVPDFEGATKQWMNANLNVAFDPLKYHFFSEVIYGNQAHDGEYHKTPMCAGYLHYLLNMVGMPKHEISYWPEFGKIPVFPGMRPYASTATLRNPQLVVEVYKV